MSSWLIHITDALCIAAVARNNCVEHLQPTASVEHMQPTASVVALQENVYQYNYVLHQIPLRLVFIFHGSNRMQSGQDVDCTHRSRFPRHTCAIGAVTFISSPTKELRLHATVGDLSVIISPNERYSIHIQMILEQVCLRIRVILQHASLSRVYYI
jgi:hypothetical protein